jgi:hypothetical protein
MREMKRLLNLLRERIRHEIQQTGGKDYWKTVIVASVDSEKMPDGGRSIVDIGALKSSGDARRI